MATYKFLYLTGFLADAVGYLGILSKALQVENPTYEYSKDSVSNPVLSTLWFLKLKDSACIHIIIFLQGNLSSTL